MTTKRISADEAHSIRKDHLRQGPDGKERLLKMASAPTTWNAEARSARFVMTAQVEDRYGDVVVTDGVSIDEFVKNPIGLLNHDSRAWPIGNWANVEKIVRGRPPRMEGDLVLHEAGGPVAEIEQAAWMIERGYMRACSIGFIPDWNEVEKVMSADGVWNGGIRFNKSELLECSLCGIPANPQALAKDFQGDRQIAQEAIEAVLDAWARDADGNLIERATFEQLYRVIKDGEDVQAQIEKHLAELDEPVALSLCEKFIAAKGKVIVSRDRIDAIERAARNKRLAEKRMREIEALRTR